MNQHDHQNLVRAVAVWRATNILTCHAAGTPQMASVILREAMRDRDPDASSAFIAALIDVGANFARLAFDLSGIDRHTADQVFAQDAAQAVLAAHEAAGLDADLEALLGAKAGEEDDDRQR